MMEWNKYHYLLLFAKSKKKAKQKKNTDMSENILTSPYIWQR